MKRVLVTGAGGFVGARILDMWRGQFALCAFPSDTLRTADENAVLRFILKEHPDVIVHTAALSNTQYCQQEPEDSFRANVLLPEWVAKGAEEVGAKLLSCSSDQVYAGVTQRGALAAAPLPFQRLRTAQARGRGPGSGPLPGCCGAPPALDVRPPGLSSAHPGQPAAEHPESGKDR